MFICLNVTFYLRVSIITLTWQKWRWRWREMVCICVSGTWECLFIWTSFLLWPQFHEYWRSSPSYRVCLCCVCVCVWVSQCDILPYHLETLQTVSAGLRKSSRDVMSSIKSLVGVFALAACILTVLSVCTLCLYMGTLRQKCIKWPVPGNSSDAWSKSDSYNHSDGDEFNFHHHVNNYGMMMMMMKQNDPLVKSPD